MRAFSLAAAALTFGLTALVLSAAASEGESDHAKDEHHFVRITSGSLHPKVQKFRTGEAFGWVNYSSEIARVSFDKGVTKKMLCTTPTRFRVTGGRFASGDIQSLQFAALCHLEPGEYGYLVELRSNKFSKTPDRTFKGTLIVE